MEQIGVISSSLSRICSGGIAAVAIIYFKKIRLYFKKIRLCSGGIAAVAIIYFKKIRKPYYKY
ncbi:MAG: hypothetical protein EU529_06640 [Promethearchaeota archaeon]|nr:MAG: hypothetical protein EU529_06640 [Candidatus Lokiarchaeota archaeon]